MKKIFYSVEGVYEVFEEEDQDLDNIKQAIAIEHFDRTIDPFEIEILKVEEIV